MYVRTKDLYQVELITSRGTLRAKLGNTEWECKTTWTGLLEVADLVEAAEDDLKKNQN